MSNVERIRIETEAVGAEQAARDIGEVADAARDLEHLSPDVEVGADTDTASEGLDDVAAKADALDGRTVDLSLEAQFADAHASLDKLDDQLARIRESSDKTDAALDAIDSAGGLAKLGDDTARVGDETGRARDNFAGFAGSAITELPGLSGAFGPLAESAGQMAEQLANGEGNMKDLLAAGLGIGAITVLIQGMQGAAEKIKAFETFDTDQVKAYTDAIRDGASAFDVLADKLRETNEVQVQITNQPLFGTHFDIAPIMDRAGVSLQDFAAVVEAGTPTIEAWGEALKDSGVKAEDANAIMAGAKDQAEKLEQAHQTSSVTARLLGDDYETASQKADRLADSTAAAEELTRKFADAQQTAADKTRNLDDAWGRLTGQLDNQEALLNLQDAFDTMQEKSAAAFNAAKTGATDTEEKTRDAERAAIDLKRQVQEYGDTVLGLPPSKVTTMLAEIDAGSYQGVQHQLDTLTADRTVWIRTALVGAQAGAAFGLGGHATGLGAEMATVVNVTQYLPRGAARFALDEAHQAARRSGGLFRKVGR